MLSALQRRLTHLLALAIAVMLCLFATASAQGSRERTMYVSAVDEKGEPVQGLGPNDFIVREDGAQREVLRVSRAIESIDIAILVDDKASSRPMRPSLRQVASGAFDYFTSFSDQS